MVRDLVVGGDTAQYCGQVGLCPLGLQKQVLVVPADAHQPPLVPEEALDLITAFMVWLGLAYGIWIATIAAFPFLWAVLLEYSIHQRRRS